MFKISICYTRVSRRSLSSEAFESNIKEDLNKKMYTRSSQNLNFRYRNRSRKIFKVYFTDLAMILFMKLSNPVQKMKIRHTKSVLSVNV